MTTLAEYADARELLGNLTQRELRGKYKRSALGWAWSLINPLALAGMFTFVFGVVFVSKLAASGNSHLHGIAAFPLYLLTGLLPWNFVSNGINGSIGALVGNANLVKKVYFPREILIGANVLSWMVSLLIELAVLGAVLLAVGNIWLKFLPLIVLMIAALTVFVTGVGLLLAILNVYFRDVQHFVGIFLQLWFYATPIIYPISLLTPHDRAVLGPIHLLTLYKLNPMTDFVEVFHQMLFQLVWPNWFEMTYAIGSAFAIFALGLFVFNKLEPRLAEEL